MTIFRPLRALAAIAGLAAAPLGDGAARAQMAGMGGGPTEVGVIALELQDVPYTVTVPGRAVAFEEVDIRPRVGGTITEIVYQPGGRVSPGDVLFRIEGATYAAQVAAAEAGLAQAQSALSAAQASLARYERLEGTGVTTADVESARVSVAQAEANVKAAEASLEVARLDLARTEIVSPISGTAAVPTVSVGALVTANQADALTTVTRIDPIYVDVEESSRRLFDIRSRIDAGSLKRGETLGIRLKLETGATYEREGRMVSPGTNVSASTGTFESRVQFDNPDRMVLPGQFLRVEVELGTTPAVLVPQGATTRAADGALTAFVAVDGKAEQRVLTEQGSYQNAWITTGGVEPGEMLIVDGLTRLRDGADVTEVPVTISDDGVPSASDGRSEAFGPPDGGGGGDDGAAGADGESGGN